MAYQSVTELRAAVPDLNDTAKFPDATLQAYVAEFEEVAENYRGVAFLTRTVVETIHSGNGLGLIPLGHVAIRSVSSLTVDGNTIASTSYTVDKLAGLIAYGVNADIDIVVTYTHGLARQVTDGVTNSSTTVTSATAAFAAADVGRPIAGTGIPVGATIVTINSATSVVISVAATASATWLTLTIGDLPYTLIRACREYVRSCALQTKSNMPRDVIGQSFEGTYTRYSTPDKAAGRPTGWLEVDRLLNSLPDYRIGLA